MRPLCGERIENRFKEGIIFALLYFFLYGQKMERIHAVKYTLFSYTHFVS